MTVQKETRHSSSPVCERAVPFWARTLLIQSRDFSYLSRSTSLPSCPYQSKQISDLLQYIGNTRGTSLFFPEKCTCSYRQRPFHRGSVQKQPFFSLQIGNTQRQTIRKRVEEREYRRSGPRKNRCSQHRSRDLQDCVLPTPDQVWRLYPGRDTKKNFVNCQNRALTKALVKE